MNKDKILEYQKEYQKEYRENNKEKIKEKMKCKSSKLFSVGKPLIYVLIVILIKLQDRKLKN